jgi:catechol 2,3-dioxygenase-like lactoylglutathione lyase family enzyme
MDPRRFCDTVDSSMKFLLCTAALALPMLCQAQIAAPNSMGVGMGHLHLNARDADAQTRFWTVIVGARPAKLGDVDVLELPGAIIFINKKAPSGGSDGSVINHVGLKVRDLKGTLAKAEAAKIKILSSNEKQAMLLAPDDIKVELTVDPDAPDPVAMHHIHFYTSDVEATRQWYVEILGAIPGQRGPFQAADLPGVNLSFSKAANPTVGTQGRAIDHIGFEVKNLAAFTKKLAERGVHFDVPYREIPRLGLSIAFFTDPWGTYIELTEGLKQVH